MSKYRGSHVEPTGNRVIIETDEGHFETRPEMQEILPAAFPYWRIGSWLAGGVLVVLLLLGAITLWSVVTGGAIHITVTVPPAGEPFPSTHPRTDKAIMTQEDFFRPTTQEESRQSRRIQARRQSMLNRQVSQVKCGSCGSFHWRDSDPSEWAPCRLCGERHGGYCAPAHGLKVSDWAAFPPRREWL